jgi:hypothetical protein
MLDLIDYSLKLSRGLIPAEATQLRGFFGTAYEDEIHLHNHYPDGSPRYTYPRVQFKVLDKTAFLIGIAEGAELVTRLWGQVEVTRIGCEELPVLEASLVRRRENFGDCAEQLSYRFRTPWLGLNQDNHQRYCQCVSETERRALLGRILLGNCLSVAKSFGHQVTSRLAAEVGKLKRIDTRLKGVPMIGFLGTFRINFYLPDRIGIGKSVSRGFGTVERLTHQEERRRSC